MVLVPLTFHLYCLCITPFQVSWDEYVADSFPEQDIKKLDPDDKKLMEEDALYFKGISSFSMYFIFRRSLISCFHSCGPEC